MLYFYFQDDHFSLRILEQMMILKASYCARMLWYDSACREQCFSIHCFFFIYIWCDSLSDLQTHEHGLWLQCKETRNFSTPSITVIVWAKFYDERLISAIFHMFYSQDNGGEMAIQRRQADYQWVYTSSSMKTYQQLFLSAESLNYETD